VNALAEAAGCDKVLIYRYFGGLDGVLEALGAERMVWPRVMVEGNGGDGEGDTSLARAVESVVLEEWAALAGGALMLQAGAAELASVNPLGKATAQQRADRHAEVIATLRARYRVPPYVDLAALVELLSAALTIFALRAASDSGTHSAASENGAPGLDPNSAQGWRRIEKTVGAVTKALLES
jgi:AcrR family transcriptional regulator